MSSLAMGIGTTDSECIPCSDTLALQEWLYLLFMLILLLLIEWYIVDYCVKRRDLPLEVLVLHLSAAAESVLSAIIVVVIMSDSDKWFTITSCRVMRMSDWYTVFYNPRNVSCTQEAVYPLFSMVFMFYGVSLILLLIIRPIIVWKSSDKNSKKTIFLTLYVIPGLAFIHSVFCGVICESRHLSVPSILMTDWSLLSDFLFPYITIIGSVISLAVHMACRLDQRTSALLKNSIRDARNATILLGHWLLHILGVIALTHMKNLVRDLIFLVAVPLPTVFYILTAKYSDPAKIHRS